MKRYQATAKTYANKSNITAAVKKECMAIIDGMKKKKEKEVKLHYRTGVTTEHKLKAPLWFSYIQICNSLDIPEVLAPTIEDQLWGEKTFWMSNDTTVSVLSVGFVCGFAASNEYETIRLSPFYHRRRLLSQMAVMCHVMDSGLPIYTLSTHNTSRQILHSGSMSAVPVRRLYQHQTAKIQLPKHHHTFGHLVSMKREYVFEENPLIGKGQYYLGLHREFNLDQGSYSRATPTAAGGALLSYSQAMDRKRVIDSFTSMELLRDIQIGDLAVNPAAQHPALPRSDFFLRLRRHIQENHIRNHFTSDTPPTFNEPRPSVPSVLPYGVTLSTRRYIRENHNPPVFFDLELSPDDTEANLRRINENTVLGVFDHVFPKQPNIEKETNTVNEEKIIEIPWNTLAARACRMAPHIGYDSRLCNNMRGLIDEGPFVAAPPGYTRVKDPRVPGSNLYLCYSSVKGETIFLQNQKIAGKKLWASGGKPPFVFHNCLFSDIHGVGALVSSNAFEHANNLFGCAVLRCSGSKHLLSAAVLSNNHITEYRYRHKGEVWLFHGTLSQIGKPQYAVRGPVGSRGATLLALRAGACGIHQEPFQIHFSTGCFFGNEEELRDELETEPLCVREDYEKAIEVLKTQLSW